MKKLLGLMFLLTITTSAFANPRCFDVQDPTLDIIEGKNFDDQDESTFISYDFETYDNLRSVEVVSSKAPRFAITKKLVYASPLGDGCKHAWEYILVDYTAELPSGEICDATFVRTIEAKTKMSMSCVKEHLPFLPLLPLAGVVNWIENLDSGCDSRKCKIQNVLKLFK
jgi:hypothetical protein